MALTPLITVFESHILLSPALEKWRQEGIWLGKERNIRWKETGAQSIQSENSWRQDLAPFGLRIW